jgi:methionine-rich copper-binding protein CopC
MAVAVLVAAAAMVLAGVVGPPELVVVTPADGAALAEPPGSVRVSFPDRPVQVHIGVSADGGSVVTGPPTVDGTAAVVPVEPAGPGTYLVRYHGELPDGREITGETTFSVDPAGGGGAGQPAADHGHGRPDLFNAVLLAADAVLLVALGLLFLRRRERSDPAGPTRGRPDGPS